MCLFKAQQSYRYVNLKMSRREYDVKNNFNPLIFSQQQQHFKSTFCIVKTEKQFLYQNVICKQKNEFDFGKAITFSV